MELSQEKKYVGWQGIESTAYRESLLLIFFSDAEFDITNTSTVRRDGLGTRDPMHHFGTSCRMHRDKSPVRHT